MWYDPYYYSGTTVLKNKFDIKDQKTLLRKEAEIVTYELYKLHVFPLEGEYDFAHLCKMHERIFGKLYSWAGKPRIVELLKEEPILNNCSIRYESPSNIEKSATKILDSMKAVPWKDLNQKQLVSEIASHYVQLWKVHPFREGNTRTITNFIIQYMEEQQIYLSRAYFAENLKKNKDFPLRDSLVLAAAYYDGIPNKDLFEPIEIIIRASIERHQKDMEKYMDSSKDGKKSLRDYYKMLFFEKEKGDVKNNQNNEVSKDRTPKDKTSFEK